MAAPITMQPTHADTRITLPAVRRIGAHDLRWSLAEGWRDFRRMRGDLILVGFLYPLVGLFAAVFALDAKLLPMLFPVVAGLTILGPAVSAGFYELARRQEAGEDAGWTHFLDPLRGRSRLPILALTGMMMGVFLAWLGAAWAIYNATLGLAPPATLGAFVTQLFTTPAGWAMIVVGNLIGGLFAVVTLMISAISFPMVVDKPMGATAAVMTSIAAFRENPGPMLGWGARIAALLVLGSLPLFIGLAVVLPVVGFATWHLYTRVVER